MHDPMTVAFDIAFPKFWRKKKRGGWRPRLHLVTVWHVDPETDGTDDSCKWTDRTGGKRPWWRHPKWHVHHWRIQVIPWRDLVKWLTVRCCVCGKRAPYGYAWTSTWDGAKRWHRECEADHGA